MPSHKIVRGDRPVFNVAKPQVYGEFILQICSANNAICLVQDIWLRVQESLAFKQGNFSPLRPQARTSQSNEDEFQSDERTKTSNTRRTAQTPASGSSLFPFPHYGQKANEFLNPDLLDSQLATDVEEAEKLLNPIAKLTSSKAMAQAALQRAVESAVVFVHRESREIESQEQRNIRSELYLYFTGSLPELLVRQVQFGDIHGLYIRIMTLGQTNDMSTRRKLNAQVAVLDKGTKTWPQYLDEFTTLQHALLAAGEKFSEDYIFNCLLHGLSKDKRYKEVIRECERDMSRLDNWDNETFPIFIAQITASAISFGDNDLIRASNSDPSALYTQRRPRGERPPRDASTKSKNSKKQSCHNHRDGKPCAYDPCPYSHEEEAEETLDGSQPATDKKADMALKACFNAVRNLKCPYQPNCRYSHDDKLVDKARKSKFAGITEEQEALTCVIMGDDCFDREHNQVAEKFPFDWSGAPELPSEFETVLPIHSENYDFMLKSSRLSRDYSDKSITSVKVGKTFDQNVKESTYPNTYADKSFQDPYLVGVMSDGAQEDSTSRDPTQTKCSAPPFEALMALGENDNDEPEACIDTGATNHFMPCRPEYIRAIVPDTAKACNITISSAGTASTSVAKCMADVWIKSPDINHPPILLKDVLYVENFRRGLVSASVLCSDGYSITFTTNACTIVDSQQEECLVLQRRDDSTGITSKLYLIPNNHFVNQQTREDSLFSLTDLATHEAHLAATYFGNSARDWHRRLGHGSTGRKSIREFYLAQGIKLLPQHDDCPDCTQAKIHHANFPKRNLVTADFCGQSFSVDFAGPYRVASPFAEKYMCLLVDVKSRYITCVGARLKSQLATIIDEYIAMAERIQQPNRVVFIVSDGALSDKNHLARLRQLGITTLIVAPGASCLNTLVERRIRTVTESGRAMNIAAGLPPTHFITACKYASIIQNHIPNQGKDIPKSTSGRNQCPQEMWLRRDYGSYPKLFGRFRTFGCLAFALHRHPNKQVAKAERTIFMGFSPQNPKAYLLYSLEHHKHVVSRDVVCHELHMPYQKGFAMATPVHATPLANEHGEIDNTAAPDEKDQPPIEEAESPVEDDDATINQTTNDPITVRTPEDTTEVGASVTAPYTSHPVNHRLSFSAIEDPQEDYAEMESKDIDKVAADADDFAVDTSDFAQRKSLGTGDVSPAIRGKPATHLQVGTTYQNITFQQPCIVQEINADGDVQVTFPNSRDEDPNTLYTVDQLEIDSTPLPSTEANSVEAVETTYSGGALVETEDGEFYPTHEFTVDLLSTSEAFSAELDQRPLRDWKMGGAKERGSRIAPLRLSDLIGKVPADSLNVPRTHYQLRDSALRPLVEHAQKLELETLKSKGVFRDAHTRLPTDEVIPTMFVNRAKGDVNGNLAKIKARLTLRGDLDKKGTPRKTYAPVPPLSSMRLLLSLHCNDPEVDYCQADYEAAFVSAKVNRRIVVSLPAGYHGPGKRVPDPVYVLDFNLYGGDDAPLVYQSDMIGKHKKMGFQTISTEHCYLQISRGTDFIKMTFHVDDFLIAHRGRALWEWYMNELSKLYKYTVSPLTHYLGMRFHRREDGTFVIDQEAQINKMCRAFNIETSNGNFPTSPILSFHESERPKNTDSPATAQDKAAASKIPYREAVGHLNYLVQTTHFEVALPVRIASAFCCNWGQKHWDWVKYIMRFLQSQASKFTYIQGGNLTRDSVTWTDSDHAGNPDNRRSMAAHLSYYGEDLLDYCAKFERIVAHSSAESELMALDKAVREEEHLRWKLIDFGATARSPSIVNMDSSSALQMAENPIQNGRNRHIHARYYYVRDLIDDHTIQLNKVPSEHNRADLLATYKDAATFIRLLGVCKPQQPPRKPQQPPRKPPSRDLKH